jgi:hypothetical protein
MKTDVCIAVAFTIVALAIPEFDKQGIPYSAVKCKIIVWLQL